MVNINGVEWRILMVSPFHSGLLRSDGSFAIGCCDDNVKIIYVSDSLSPQLTKKVIAHELTHAAMFSYGIVLNIEQEEVLADLIATYGEEISDITDEIFARLKEIRGLS